MKKATPWLAAVFMLFWTLTPLLAASGREPGPVVKPTGGTEVTCAGPNLIFNPSFEGQFTGYVPPNGHPDCNAGICDTAQMAPGWVPWWRSHDPADDPWVIRMPEFKPALSVFENPVRVRSGATAQQYFSFFSTHEAGFLQQVAVTPGVDYCFSVWGHAWSADDDDNAYSGPEFGIFNMRVGIDPSGVSDWPDGSVVWSDMREQYDYYDPFLVEARAQVYNLTVFAYSNPQYAVKHNDAYWDDAHLAPIWLKPLPTAVSLQEVGQGFVDTRVVYVNLSGRSDLTWTAQLGAGSAPVQLLQSNGGVGDNLTIRVNGTGLPLGTYTRPITLTASEPIAGSPATVMVTLSVVSDIATMHFPSVQRE